MKNPFAWLTAIGLGAVGAHFLGFDFHLFDWIDSFGEVAGRSVRAALAAGGVVIFMLTVARPYPERKARSEAPANPPVDAKLHIETQSVRTRWPKLARRSAYLRAPLETAAAPRSSHSDLPGASVHR